MNYSIAFNHAWPNPFIERTTPSVLRRFQPLHHRWSIFLSLSALCQLVVAAPPTEQRTFENDRLGKVQFVVPVEWETYDRHHINFGTTVLSGKNRKAEEFEISFNDAERMQFKWASEAELREFVAWQMRQYLSQSVEGNAEIKVERGPNLVVYSTLTDKQPKPGEFKFVTLGAARTGDAVFLIYHLTNERQRVQKVVSAVAEAKRVPK
ncbi:hypothetical protein [Polaromonas sp. A23]|uniref:hypothetical protein n=1 Tax=Polaromonas sp. A23 TaxID=1944133 RepID=UPI0009879794|nr:hypothetical protein [Polaromonas sp. A23]OOG38418.1 hypothetical protein B0B52_16740 [Polaromonas sp. A23]